MPASSLFRVSVAGVRLAGFVAIIWTLISWKNTHIPDALPVNLCYPGMLETMGWTSMVRMADAEVTGLFYRRFRTWMVLVRSSLDGRKCRYGRPGESS